MANERGLLPKARREDLDEWMHYFGVAPDDDAPVRVQSMTTTKTADALSVEGWRRGVVHREAGRVRGASGLSLCPYFGL